MNSSLLDCEISAIDRHDRARHELGVVRAQKPDDRADFSWPAPPSQRDAIEDLRLACRILPQGAGHLSRDPARCDSIHADAVSRRGGRQRLAQLHDAALAGAVGRHPFTPKKTQHGRKIDNRTLCLCQKRTRGQAHPHRPNQVHIYDPGEVRDVVLGPAAEEDSRRIDQRIETGQRTDMRIYGRFVRHVED